MCKYCCDNPCACPECMEGEIVIDCRYVPITSFNQVGEAIVGDLKKYGWVVVRGLIPIDPSTAAEINNMDMKGAGTQ